MVGKGSPWCDVTGDKKLPCVIASSMDMCWRGRKFSRDLGLDLIKIFFQSNKDPSYIMFTFLHPTAYHFSFSFLSSHHTSPQARLTRSTKVLCREGTFRGSCDAARFNQELWIIIKGEKKIVTYTHELGKRRMQGTQ